VTTHRTKGRYYRPGRKLSFLILIAVVALGTTVGWTFYSGEKDVNEAVQQQTDAASAPVPTNRPITLKAVLPPLSTEQTYYLKIVRREMAAANSWLQLSPNDQEVFVALMLTESSLRPFDNEGEPVESSMGCLGLGQICNLSIMDPELRGDPEENAKAAATYFAELLKESDGDYSLAIAKYKGAFDTDGTTGQVIYNRSHDHVLSVFAFLRLD
jgi:hypothetical protein